MLCFVFLNASFLYFSGGDSCIQFVCLMYRSQVRLQRFGDQLVSDISRIGANEEDLSVDIVSNGENTGHPPITKHNLELSDASPRRKRLHVEEDAVEELKQGSSLGKIVILVLYNCF